MRSSRTSSPWRSVTNRRLLVKRSQTPIELVERHVDVARGSLRSACRDSVHGNLPSWRFTSSSASARVQAAAAHVHRRDVGRAPEAVLQELEVVVNAGLVVVEVLVVDERAFDRLAASVSKPCACAKSAFDSRPTASSSRGRCRSRRPARDRRRRDTCTARGAAARCPAWPTRSDTRSPSRPPNSSSQRRSSVLPVAAAAGPPYSFCGFSPHTMSGMPICTASAHREREDRDVLGPRDVADLARARAVELRRTTGLVVTRCSRRRAT